MNKCKGCGLDTSRVTVFCPSCDAQRKTKYPVGTRVRIDPHHDFPESVVSYGVVTSAGHQPRTMCILPDGEEYARYAVPEDRVNEEWS